jgi:hypothetical protein
MMTSVAQPWQDSVTDPGGGASRNIPMISDRSANGAMSQAGDALLQAALESGVGQHLLSEGRRVHRRHGRRSAE